MQAHSMAVLIGLAGLAGIPAYLPESLRADEVMPCGRATIVVRDPSGCKHELAMRPALVQLVARLKRMRPHGVEGRLFDGAPYLRIWRAGQRMGSRETLWRLLRNFFDQSLYRSGEPAAIDCYLSIVRPGDGDPHLVTPSALKRLILGTDPLGGEAGWVDNDEVALRIARDAGSRLAATFAESVARPTRTIPPPPEDHPLIVEIAATEREPGRKGAAARLHICLRHLAELDRTKRDGSLPDRRVAELFGVTLSSYKATLLRARRRIGTGDAPSPRPKVRAPLTTKEAARVSRIVAAAWPAGKTAAMEFRRQLFVKHGGFVSTLVTDGKLAQAAAADLFHMSPYCFRELRSYAASGMITRRFARATPEERAKWKDVVLRELPHRPPGPVTAFIDRLRESFGVTLPDNVIYRIIREASQPPTRPKSRGRIRTGLTRDEKSKLDVVARAVWPPVGQQVNAFRRHFIAAHADFVFGLLRARKIGREDAAKLFRISGDRIQLFGRLHLEGLLAPALEAPQTPEERKRRQLLVERELLRKPADMPTAEFCRRVTRKFGFHVSADRVAKMLRSAASGTKLPRARRRRWARPPLEKGELDRLRRAKSAMQNDGREPAERRVEVLRGHGVFLMTLLEQGKLGNGDVADLLGMDAPRVSGMRADFRDGQFVHHCQPRAPEHERRRWIAVAERKCRSGPPGERRHQFIRRIRRIGAPLEDHTIGRVFDAVSRASRKDPD